jgi:hypothetical protein
MRCTVKTWIADIKDGRKEMIACQEATEVRLECEEPTSVDTESEAERREVPTEEDAVKSSRTMKKRHRGWKPAAGRCASQRNWPEETVYPGGSARVAESSEGTVSGPRLSEKSEECGRATWQEGTEGTRRRKEAISEKQDLMKLQEDHWTADHEANCQIY